MEPYIFHGLVLPDHVKLSVWDYFEFTHPSSGAVGRAKMSIVDNKIEVSVESDHPWKIYDLRNVAKYIVQSHLAMYSYLTGNVHEFSLTRVVSPSRGIDHLFEIDIPCIAELRKSVDVQEGMRKIKEKYATPGSMLLNRCFKDLASALNDADDTAFYCYRAIESLRLHCGVVHGIPETNKKAQWAKFHELAGCSEASVRVLEEAATPLRHGGVTGITDEEGALLYVNTWAIVDGYLKCV
jgi:hypothetical protein